MDRLTFRSDDESIPGVFRVCHYPRNMYGDAPCFNCIDRTKCNNDIFERLCKYEDLGFSPEQLKELLEDKIGITHEKQEISNHILTQILTMTFSEKARIVLSHGCFDRICSKRERFGEDFCKGKTCVDCIDLMDYEELLFYVLPEKLNDAIVDILMKE